MELHDNRMVTFTGRNTNAPLIAVTGDAEDGKGLVTTLRDQDEPSAPPARDMPIIRARRRRTSVSTAQRDKLRKESTKRIIHVLFLEQEKEGEPGGGITLAQATKILCQFGTEVSVEEVAVLYREVSAKSASDAGSNDSGRRRQQRDDSNSISRVLTSMLHSIIGMSGRISNSTWSVGRDAAPGVQHSIVEVRISFESLMLIFEMWQSAAEFRMFEMREERAQRHIDVTRTTKTLLQPDSAAMFAWQSLMIVVSLVSALLVLEAHVQLHNDTLPSYFAAITGPEIVITAMFAVSIAVKVGTAMVVQSDHNGVLVTELVDDAAAVARRYLLSMWFVADVLAMLPLRGVFFAGGDEGYCVVRAEGVHPKLPARVDGGSLQEQSTQCDERAILARRQRVLVVHLGR